jgi:hypothetical protein
MESALLHEAIVIKIWKQDQQRRVAFNERNPLITRQQLQVARKPGEPQTKTGQGARLNTDKLNLQKLGTKDSLKPLCKVDL